MPAFALVLRPSCPGCGVVEISVVVPVGMETAMLVALAELLEVALALDTPIVAAIDTPSFSSQHVVFPP
jgi:hypothetical protein